jgi:hypothetical protein
VRPAAGEVLLQSDPAGVDFGVEIAWAPPADASGEVRGYRVELFSGRGVANANTIVARSEVGATTTSLRVDGVAFGAASVTARVTLLDGAGVLGDPLVSDPLTLPVASAGALSTARGGVPVLADPTEDGFTANWQPAPGSPAPAGYLVRVLERRHDLTATSASFFIAATLDAGDATSTRVAGLAGSSRYVAAVVAYDVVDGVKRFRPSSSTSAVPAWGEEYPAQTLGSRAPLTPWSTPPAAPVVTGGDSATTAAPAPSLTWTGAPTEGRFTGGSPVTGYRIQLHQAGTGLVATVDSPTPTATFPGVTPGARYSVRVAAVNAVGTGELSDFSPSVTVAGTAPQPGSGEEPGTDPSAPTGPRTLTDAVLRWGLNDETNNGAYFGGCNFLSAGKTPDPGGSAVFTEGQFAANSGAVRIEKPDASGRYTAATWATRCLDRTGAPLRTGSATPYGGSQFVITGGTGEVDPATGRASIRWTGDVTVAYYGGMTFWYLSDPQLTVENGVGTLTATASGFGTDMDDRSKWQAIAQRTVTLATLPGVRIGAEGFVAEPTYRGVAVSLPAGQTPQSREGADWGSFPQSFIDFQLETGQAAYWYSSGGQADGAKPATAVTVGYDAATFTPDAPAEVPTAEKASARVPLALRPPPRSPLAPIRVPPATASAAGVPGDAEATTALAASSVVIVEGMPEPALSRTELVLALLVLLGLGVIVVVSAVGSGAVLRLRRGNSGPGELGTVVRSGR